METYIRIFLVHKLPLLADICGAVLGTFMRPILNEVLRIRQLIDGIFNVYHIHRYSRGIVAPDRVENKAFIPILPYINSDGAEHCARVLGGKQYGKVVSMHRKIDDMYYSMQLVYCDRALVSIQIVGK